MSPVDVLLLRRERTSATCGKRLPRRGTLIQVGTGKTYKPTQDVVIRKR